MILWSKKQNQVIKHFFQRSSNLALWFRENHKRDQNTQSLIQPIKMLFIHIHHLLTIQMLSLQSPPKLLNKFYIAFLSHPSLSPFPLLCVRVCTRTCVGVCVCVDINLTFLQQEIICLWCAQWVSGILKEKFGQQLQDSFRPTVNIPMLIFVTLMSHLKKARQAFLPHFYRWKNNTEGEIGAGLNTHHAMMESVLEIYPLTSSSVFIFLITSQFLPSYQESLPPNLPLKVLSSS